MILSQQDARNDSFSHFLEFPLSGAETMLNIKSERILAAVTTDETS
jgi:hypothetical protein